jgi:PAS domain S-box-containing protein
MDKPEESLKELFQQFQKKYSQASSLEKKRLADLFTKWVDSQPVVLEKLENKFSLRENLDAPKQGEFSKLESEIHLRQMVEGIEQVYWVRDLKTGKILYVSPAFEAVWGRSCESLYADPGSFLEAVHPEDRLQVMVNSPHNDRKIINQEYRIIRPDGSLRWISARVFLIHEENQEPYRVVNQAQDITDHKNIEQALRQSLDRTHERFMLSRKMSLARNPEVVLKTLMSAQELRSAYHATLVFFENPDSVSSRGVEQTMTWQSSRIASKSPGELNLHDDSDFWELVKPDKLILIRDILNDVRLKPGIRKTLMDGSIRALIISPLVTLGIWLGCLLVFYDEIPELEPVELHHIKVLVDQATITLYNLQLLQTEAESRHEAEHANEIKTQFLAMVSHELRTPLTSIIGFTTTLLANDVAWDPEEQRDFIQTIHIEANRLDELINQLLDLSRLEAGMLPIVPEYCSLKNVIDEAFPFFQTITKGHNIAIFLPENLPQVYIDKRRIMQVLNNLIQNAAVYSPEGTDISVSAITRGGLVQVNVADQGPGIPADERKRVFKAFTRGVKEEIRSMKGAGLGLAICRGLIEAQGGHIWIKKKNSPGATISFTIPCENLPVSMDPF